MLCAAMHAVPYLLRRFACSSILLHGNERLASPLPSSHSVACLLTSVLCSKTYCARPCAITPTASLAAPDGSGLRCYNDIQNEAYEASERPGWRHYQPPAAEVKPLLAASIAYTFPAEEVGELGVAVSLWHQASECALVF